MNEQVNSLYGINIIKSRFVPEDCIIIMNPKPIELPFPPVISFEEHDSNSMFRWSAEYPMPTFDHDKFWSIHITDDEPEPIIVPAPWLQWILIFLFLLAIVILAQGGM